MTPTVERRYQMTRLQAGDYLLPSNDGLELWRITRYYEEGSLEHYDGTKDQNRRPLVSALSRVSGLR